MKYLRNERGVALMLALILAVVSLTLSAGLIYLVTQGTRISGAQKQYRTALEASYGAMDLMEELINSRGDLVLTDPPLTLDADTDPCLSEKLNNSDTNWPNCTAQEKSSDPWEAPDFDILLGEYRVRGKIVKTVVGNSDTNQASVVAHGVVHKAGFPKPPALSYMYTILVRSHNNRWDPAKPESPQERSDLAALYAY